MPVLRTDLQNLARMRLREARRLLSAREYCGAYYLTGLAVECAIKARIARDTQRHEFPDKTRAGKCFDHDLEKLVKLAGLNTSLTAQCTLEPIFDANWGIVKDWKVECRYNPSMTRADAQAIYSAVASRRNGILRWLRQNW